MVKQGHASCMINTPFDTLPEAHIFRQRADILYKILGYEISTRCILWGFNVLDYRLDSENAAVFKTNIASIFDILS